MPHSSRLFFHRSVLLCAGLAVLASARVAEAAPSDAKAQELADQAIFTDYLALDFKAAEDKLKKAIALCEKKRACSATVQAQVYRDLAVIYVTGMKRTKDGQDLLVKALRKDPKVALDADLTTPDLVRVFGAAKDEVAKGPEEEEAALPAAAPPPPEPEKPKAAPKPNPDEEEEEEEGDEEEEEEEEKPVGSLDSDPSVDCPPDFPGCEATPPPDEKTEEEEEEADLGVLNWLSAALQQDFLMFSGETGVCATDRPTELSCYRAGDVFRDPNLELTAGDAGEVSGGFTMATTRILLGYDRVLFPNISAGARVGYAIGGGPAEPNGPGFLPIHAEVRGTYWFAPIEIGTIRPYATLGGGLAQVDSSVTTQVIDRNALGQVALSRVTVWKKTGTTFGSIGGGVMYPLSDGSGITAELKGVLLFPSSGMSLSLQAGYTHGF